MKLLPLVLLLLLQDPPEPTPAYLGVALGDLDAKELAALGIESGVRVREVPPGTPAERAGIRAGDVLLAVGGKPAKDSRSLPPLVRAMEPGKTVDVELLRGGQKITIAVTLGYPPGEAPPDAERERVERLLKDAVELGRLIAAASGTVVRADVEKRTVDVAKEGKLARLTFDVALEKSTSEELAGEFKASKSALGEAVEIAVRKTGGKAYRAGFDGAGVAEIGLLAKGRLQAVRVEGKVLCVGILDLPYLDDGVAKHRLDLFVPETEKPFPVILWIHGGAWSMGDRVTERLLGHRFAERGVGFAAVSYRLSRADWIQPGGRKKGILHPEHVRDCAAAFAWLHAHVKEYGGDPERLFVSGHSAGGQLSALMALDPKYLAERKLELSAIKGAIPLDGCYDLVKYIAVVKEGMGEETGKRHMTDVFGPDEEALRAASPTTYLKGSTVPVLAIFESGDAAMGRYARHFKEAVEKEGAGNVTFLEIPGRTHATLRTKMEEGGSEACRDAMIEVVLKQK